ncbi:MAG: hypothetical protein TEF_10270 [Rhizobiales bacterium NRL2]|jgi:hypothetical protein|nr:MAG: hypothetical protein TEF_10270 [Rhizobiales bacterium NRL2]
MDGAKTCRHCGLVVGLRERDCPRCLADPGRLKHYPFDDQFRSPTPAETAVYEREQQESRKPAFQWLPASSEARLGLYYIIFCVVAVIVGMSLGYGA